MGARPQQHFDVLAGETKWRWAPTVTKQCHRKNRLVDRDPPRQQRHPVASIVREAQEIADDSERAFPNDVVAEDVPKTAAGPHG